AASPGRLYRVPAIEGGPPAEAAALYAAGRRTALGPDRAPERADHPGIRAIFGAGHRRLPSGARQDDRPRRPAMVRATACREGVSHSGFSDTVTRSVPTCP